VTAGRPSVDALVQLNQATVATSLVSGLIHDLNNSLLVIGGSVELMEDGPLGEDSRPRLERIKRQHQAMAQRLRELAGVLAPEGGSARADLVAVLTQACALRETSTRRRGVTVRIETGEASCLVPVRPERLLQLVLNLLLNAETAVREAPRREIVCTIALAGGTARLTVADSGAGVEAAVRERAFEPFITSAPDDHAGLGLYVSRAIAAGAGGTLTLAGGAEGTTVTLALPVGVSAR